MKKLISLALSILLAAGMFAGCSTGSSSSSSSTVQSSSSEALTESSLASSSSTTEEIEAPVEMPDVTRVSALKGATAMGMVKLMHDSDNDETRGNYDFTIATIDEIVPKISTGSLDIAAIPANLASVLYHNTEGAVQVLAINLLGTLYVVEKGESIQSVADLAGRTIYSTGKGATPEFALNHVLTANSIDPLKDINVEFKSEAAEIIPLLAQSADGVAILPQPFVTTALANVPGLRVALDWTEEWDKVSTDSGSLVTGVMIVRKEFAEKYPEAVKIFATEYEASTRFTETNLEEAAALVGEYGIVDASVAEKAIPACNITYIDGLEMMDKLSGYLGVLAGQNPQSVGGSLPDENFYYLIER